MKPQTFRQIIVASGLAALVGTVAITFALRPHDVAAAAQTAYPPALLEQMPGDIPAAAAENPDDPAVVAQRGSVSAKTAATAMPSAVEPRSVAIQQLAKAGTDAVASNHSDARIEAPAESSKEPAVTPVATIAYPLEAANDFTMAPATDGVPAIAQIVAATAESPASDSQITAAVKSEIAVDGAAKDANIGVTTTNGAVVLTGSLANQTDIDHIKDVAAKIKDVKSVDTSALILASGSDAS